MLQDHLSKFYCCKCLMNPLPIEGFFIFYKHDPPFEKGPIYSKKNFWKKLWKFGVFMNVEYYRIRL
jgi:hypothetical protein